MSSVCDSPSAPAFEDIDIKPLVAIKWPGEPHVRFFSTLMSELLARGVSVTSKEDAMYTVIIKDVQNDITEETQKHPDAAVVLWNYTGISHAELGNAHIIARMCDRLWQGDAKNLVRIVMERIETRTWGT